MTQDDAPYPHPQNPAGGTESARMKPMPPLPPAPPAPPAQSGTGPENRAALPFGMTPYPPTVQLPPSRRNYALFAGAGLVVGLGAGLLLAQIDRSSNSTALLDAVELCELTDQTGIELGDEGQSLTMSGQGEETLGYGADFLDIHCVLSAIDMPDSVGSRLGNTRALDGTQTAQWGEFSTFWNYHPDDGMNVIVEVVGEE
ncbi:hypothetical protein NNX28_03205 [Arthrobacter sp. zg-Y859]|uniref:Uncharacterized protein n=1 Tax=Arthrobacter jinronghuae TaxID=2964609 RepID=A0ABT1NMJ4_9MICC|nr:hypothetical protein [Arthrobacter jinronghuae]MCQ1948936.1 hypothetical protein [Arthrobacter jinronghuae]UWX78260.1 hypothetical protein N2K98_15060 [Arthrobacter jinronghuae]